MNSATRKEVLISYHLYGWLHHASSKCKQQILLTLGVKGLLKCCRIDSLNRSTSKTLSFIMLKHVKQFKNILETLFLLYIAFI